MKIAFLIEHLDPSRGGMERSAADFLTELVKFGLQIHVVTQTSAWAHPGVKVHAFGVSGWTEAGQYRQFIERAHRFLSDPTWDVRHAIRPCLTCDVYQPRGGIVKAGQERTVALRRSGVARLIRQAALFFDAKERLLTSLEQRLLGGVASPLVVVPSEYVRRQVDHHYRLPDASIRRVFNGVRVPVPAPSDRTRTRRRLREELGLTDEALVAVFVGHNFRRKGVSRLLECLSRRSAQHWHLLIVGREPAGPYERYAQRLNVADRVRFLGSRTDVPDLYCAADVCVLPTYNDPCSRTILEALSLGLPCITTGYDGSSECISDGEQGFVVDTPESVDAFANALQKLSDGETRRHMSEKATALGPFLAMRRHAAEMIAVYESIVGRRANRLAVGPT